MTSEKTVFLTDIQKIIEHDDLKKETVDVPEWGGVVRVRALTGFERTEYIKILTGNSLTHRGEGDRIIQSNVGRAQIYAAAVGMIDEDGKQLAGPDYVDELENKSGIVLQRVGDAVLRLSGMTGDDDEEAIEALGEDGAALPLTA